MLLSSYTIIDNFNPSEHNLSNQSENKLFLHINMSTLKKRELIEL
jgi:hypothetical protein